MPWKPRDDCGHPITDEDDPYGPCYYCDEYREAHELHALEDLLDTSDQRVIPHTRG